jgi:shikimate dehydrogenase
MTKITGQTSVLALIGRPVKHSLSPTLHNASFQADGLYFVYVCLDVDPAELPAAVRGMAALKLRGFNVTMPHKQAVAALVDELDESAAISGAVNTVVIDEGGRLRGYNTDGGGMVMACEEAGVRLAGSKALILGAGGAAAAIANALGGAGVEELHIVNRSEKNATNLRDKLRDAGLENVQAHPLDVLEGDVLDADIVVNATSLGMKDGDSLPVPAEYIQKGRTFCDAVYRPGAETTLIRLARERGARVVAGDRMLLYQGVLAQELWTGREPNVDAMDRALHQ